jgi:transcription-repair coupling factor (superfamily II helicase)
LELTGVTRLLAGSRPFARLREEIAGGRVRRTIGAGDAAKAAAVAALVQETRAPVVLLTARLDRAEALAEQIAAWLGDELRVHLFPERDALPFERLEPAPETVRDRLEALALLDEGAPALIVAGGLAVAQRTLSPAELSETLYRLQPGLDLDVESFLRALAALGYSFQPVVQAPGEAGRRGGIIDVFPPAAHFPVRIELAGRRVESLRLFDPATQRSVRRADSVLVGPAREAVVGGRPLPLLDRIDLSRCSPEARERFEEEIALLRGGDAPAGLDFYVPFLASAILLDHLPPDSLVIVDEEQDIAAAVEEAIGQAEISRIEMERSGEIPRGLPSPLEPWDAIRRRLAPHPRLLTLSRLATGEEPDGVRLPFLPPAGYAGQLRKLVMQLASEPEGAARRVIVSLQAQRLSDLLTEEGRPAAVRHGIEGQPGGLELVRGALPEGWRFRDGETELWLITDSEIFGAVKHRRPPPRRAVHRDAFLAELTPGSYVVHIDHGIARFAGAVRLTMDGHEREYLELQYAEGDRLFVPADQLDRVTRYVGPSDRMPQPTRLGSGDWQRAKARVKRAVAALARDLLVLYAAREVAPGHAYPPDTPWQMELEAAFPFVETPDQLSAIKAVKRDMEQPRPMDRLVCGDVGYGKTEVAVRAAFKAVMDGRQAAVLVPTTVLAQQHYQTFRERLAAFPLRVDVLSRFRSDAEQKAIVEELASGAIDIIIGTHRLLQRDVSFKDLGLVVIDEEQRFGVGHKEHLKKMRQEVDVLTLSATPIPRTLYMAMGGIREMSTMETPPEERLPIKTYVSEFDERTVRDAIVRELERSGQVYFVHNRVHNIDIIARKLQEIVPEARVSTGHGQMDEKLLAQVMEDFVAGRTDVLVCTTIIESGLDIPNVNTIIINQADKLGLAQLYQLRGRVGRGAHRAYAYLLYDRRARLTETAKQRLQTIFAATELGSGFQIAQRDLEIRGAGNLLGPEQSGFMAAVGFDLYVKLLSGQVERMRALMRGEMPPPGREDTAVSISLPISAHLPPSYVPDVNVRLALYQRLSAAQSPLEVSEIAQEMADRFGDPPPVARNLFYIASLRTLALKAGVQSITGEDGAAVLRMKEEQTLERGELDETAPKGVQAGRTMLRVELGNGWRERLRRTLEELAALRGNERLVGT